MKSFIVNGEVWKYEGPAGWYFVYVDKKDAKQIKESKTKRVGFGFIPVNAKIGNTKWSTTLFPSKSGDYLIAIKSTVRRAENIHEGDSVSIKCKLL